MILNNIICFNVLLDGDINFISKDDGSSVLKIQDDTYKFVNDIKTAKSCQYYGQPNIKPKSTVPHCVWHDDKDNYSENISTGSTIDDNAILNEINKELNKSDTEDDSENDS